MFWWVLLFGNDVYLSIPTSTCNHTIKYVTQHCRELYYHTHLPDSAVTFFSSCVLSALLSAENLLVDNVIQTTFCLLRFPRKMNVINNDSCLSTLHQSPGQYQNLDKIYSKFCSNCHIPRSTYR